MISDNLIRSKNRLRMITSLNRSLRTSNHSLALTHRLLSIPPTSHSTQRLSSYLRYQHNDARSTLSEVDSDIKNYDIVIVGGGPVGLALANALGSCPDLSSYASRIAILDSNQLSNLKNWNPKPNEWSNRVSSVTNQNLDFLKRIGVFEHLDESRTNPVERMEVWDGLSNARIIFDSLDLIKNSNLNEIPQMARFIENVHLQSAMLKALEFKSNVDLFESSKVKNIVADQANWPVVNMEDGNRFRARLLVGADGFKSPVKSYSQITSTGSNYDAHCVVGTLELTPTSFNHTAWQRFLLSGPLGFLPLSDRHASLAWSTKPDIATALKKMDGPTLASMVNACYKLPHESVNYLLSKIVTHAQLGINDWTEIRSEIDWRSSESVNGSNQLTDDQELPPKVIDVRMETVASFPLRMFHADQYVGQPDLSSLSSNSKKSESIIGPRRTVLVGDAAHVLHPMAGQGLNMGLGDAKELAKTISLALQNGQDIGGLTALVEYGRTRYWENRLIMTSVDRLNELYSIDLSPIVWLRSVGVEVLNELSGLKLMMMNNAGGKQEEEYKDEHHKAWSKVADLYETGLKIKLISEGLSKWVIGNIKSGIHRATAP